MSEPVIVIVGDWECEADGSWVFKSEKNIMAQCITINRDMDFVQLKEAVSNEFDLSGSNMEPNLSFWMPAALAVLSATERPPVCIKNDHGLRTFRAVREGREWVSLFVSFSSIPNNNLEGELSASSSNGEEDARRLDGSAEGTRKDGSEDGSSMNWDYGVVRVSDTPPTSGEGLMWMEDHNSENTSQPIMIGDKEDKVATANSDGGKPKEHSVGQTSEYRRKGKAKVGDRCSSSRVGRLKPSVLVLSDTDEDTDMYLRNSIARHQVEDSGICHNHFRPVADANDQVVPVMADMMDVDMLMPVVPQASTTSNRLHSSNFVAGDSGGNLINGVVGNGSSELRTPSDCSIDEDICDEEAMCESPAPSDFDELNVRSTLEVLYDEIRSGEAVATKDVTPQFDDTYVLTGQEAAVPYDEANDAIYVGRQFRNKEELLLILRLHAIKRKFTFKGKWSDKKRVIAKCVDPQCEWRVFAHIVSPLSPNMEIRTARLTHSCTVATRSKYGKQANAKVVAHVLKNRFTNGKEGPRAVEIPEIVLQELRVSITYMKAWYAKEQALEDARGTEEESYKLLRAYLYLLKKENPGTIYNIKTKVGKNGQNRFKYMFFALGACIAGLPWLRPVVVVDGTAIKAKFKGVMLTASLQDANFRIFPLGFAVVDGENDAAWTWFLNELSAVLPDSDNLMIISDRHQSIYNAVEAVYPQAQHGACSVHLARNVRYRFKGQGISYLVSKAATAYSVGDFRRWFTEIERRSPDCANYLHEIGLSHWTQAYCYGMRYNVTSTNSAESLNATMAKALQYPIVSMLESIRMNIMRWFCWRREEARNQSSVLTDGVEKEVLAQLQDSGGHSVLGSTEWIFQVNTVAGETFTVDLERRSCTCRFFDKIQLPCSHALAAARVVDMPVNVLCAPVYTAEFLQKTYAGIIMPVPNREDEEMPEEGNADLFTEPETRRGLGRPRKRRITSTGEMGRKRRKTGQNRCSRCFEKGHNKSTCKEPLP